ncbi:unnamed protein product [Cochlearia groenlandica]
MYDRDSSYPPRNMSNQPSFDQVQSYVKRLPGDMEKLQTMLDNEVSKSKPNSGQEARRRLKRRHGTRREEVSKGR